MPIRPPALDDRNYDDLLRELLARIPAHTPEWTHAKVGDPGRTLLELFAWLGDALLYRVNLIPERQRLAFLRLLGQPLRPARPATGLVVVSPKETAPVKAFPLLPRATFSGAAPFEAPKEFTVLPLSSLAYYKRPILREDVPIELESLAEFHNEGNPVAGYATTSLLTDGRTQSSGHDIVADTADRALWLALFAPAAKKASEQEAKNNSVSEVLKQSASGGGQIINVGFDPALPSTDPLEPATARPAIPHLWEITVNRSGASPNAEAPWKPEYTRLDQISDTTGGLTQRGIVRLALPAGIPLHAPTNDVRLDPEAGVGDRPPRLDDEALAARLIAWMRLRPVENKPTADAPDLQFKTGQGSENLQSSQSGAAQITRQVESLRVIWTGVNATSVEQYVTRADLVIGESSGAADQEYALPASSVDPETLHLQIVEDGNEVTWTRIDDLATLDRNAMNARDARVFQLDAEAGTLQFGDGVRGRIPPTGGRIIVRSMRSGGGSAGNLAAHSLKAIKANSVLDNAPLGSLLTVSQPLDLTGGADAESLAEAEKRIPAFLRHRERAVTSGDYQALALTTPGVFVGRVELLPGFKPQQRHEDIPGVITVMALPSRSLAPAPNPRADRPFLETVHAWLDARKPLGAELYVIGCEYRPIAIGLGVEIAADSAIESTKKAIKDALTNVLWPLPTGGFDQKGWPLGRPLSNRELAVEVARVPGVSEISGLNLFERNVNSGAWEPVSSTDACQEQNIELKKWQLPELLGVTIAIGDAPSSFDPNGSILDPGSPTNPYIDPNTRPLTVPIVPEHC